MPTVLDNGIAVAEPTWGAMKYMREGEPELLSEEDASVMTEAREQYSQAVESSLATAQPGSPAVLGQPIRHAFHKVLFAVHHCCLKPPPQNTSLGLDQRLLSKHADVTSL